PGARRRLPQRRPGDGSLAVAADPPRSVERRRRLPHRDVGRAVHHALIVLWCLLPPSVKNHKKNGQAATRRVRYIPTRFLLGTRQGREDRAVCRTIQAWPYS